MLPVGSPAIGEDFIDRKKEVEYILSALKKDSVLLIAPRRFGKTSIMKRVEKELLDEDKICVFYKGMSGMEEKAARALLRRICSVDYYPINLAFGIYKQETGNDDYEKFMDLIADLGNDFYIEYDPKKGLKFYSKMLRDWWRVYYGDNE
ncbi:MAG: Archaeal ATPase [Candidatus Methanoperedens nitroreducens]|uniref:Archaeal ATPase n=1 Tax=Candidatus Methanoperedens nitratireducens TaxID=1392998 RepID=A0A0P7ZJ92_9EURY|nr:ATP-binding protein [Candidatus Methanoperedens sp. BLZ2]KAB2942672.1 MAG: ATP-binding protein [Candidatus Methanoperedens sp.]KPQ45132.1 MAG: Archaeal ATPase [Candidatus Methanoperedens sp. BLZ1]MBZ0177464.1 ATP-binding protein [Candidatus Methanoperedens nitroreducens]MCX9079174.1 ATP-binding protein [Candidatus Methanoperedens sp.]